jgi:hypothetical protein
LQKSSAVFGSPEKGLLSLQEIINATDHPVTSVTKASGVDLALSFCQLSAFVPSLGNEAISRGSVFIVLVLIQEIASLQKPLKTLERHLFEMQMQNKQLLDHIAAQL